jgi:hypothetical protein
VARMGEERRVYKVLIGKPEGKKPLERPKRRWDQNGSWVDWLGSAEWIQFAQDRDKCRTRGLLLIQR